MRPLNEEKKNQIILNLKNNNFIKINRSLNQQFKFYIIHKIFHYQKNNHLKFFNLLTFHNIFLNLIQFDFI